MNFKCFLQHTGRGREVGAAEGRRPGDQQQRPAPGGWGLEVRAASPRIGPSLPSLSNIGRGCEIMWVLRNRPGRPRPWWQQLFTSVTFDSKDQTPYDDDTARCKKRKKKRKIKRQPDPTSSLESGVPRMQRSSPGAQGESPPPPTRTGRGTGRCG